MNMQVLKRSRKEPQEGDIFVYKMKGQPYRYGRVIRMHTKIGGFTDVILLYFYRAFSDEKISIPKLDKHKLLLAPLGTNRRPWTMGYFETVEHRPLAMDDILSTHCFKDDTYIKCKYRDEYGQELEHKKNPCGLDALHSFRTIDARISDALGIEPAPDTV